MQEKIKKFYEMVSKEVYSEEDSPLHMSIIKQVAKDLFQRSDGPKKGQVLVDMGSGSGFMLDQLVELGLDKKDLIAVTYSEDDFNTVKEKGYTAHNCDMSFTNFENNSIDWMIVRHCLEHSVWPYLTLLEFNRIMKIDSRVYIEMPAPEVTDRNLEHWPNHYSVMGKKQWGSLMLRAGFDYINGTYPLSLKTTENPDKNLNEPYDWYIMTKILDRSDYEPADAKFMQKVNSIILERQKNDNASGTRTDNTQS